MTQKKPLPITERFGKAIRQRRRELDLTQEALAERADLHRTFISLIERGETSPTLDNVERLAQALNISITELLCRYKVELVAQQPFEEQS